MKKFNETYVIGIDHGYGNMKTANCCFPTGVMKTDTEKERIKISTEKLRKYFPKNYTVQQIEDEIIKLCEKNYRMKQRGAR